MKSFWGHYSNGKYKVGMSGSVWVYDMDDNLIGRFKETPYSYSGAFVPEKNVFVNHSNECHLVVYDLDEMRILKKIKTSNCNAAESEGMAFSNDGKLLYCIQAHDDDWLSRRLVVYDTKDFEVVEEYFSDEKRIVVSEIEIDEDKCYIFAGERAVGTGEIKKSFVGLFCDGEITARKDLSEDIITVEMCFSWKRSGFTEKSYPQLLKDDFKFDPKKHKDNISLKRLYDIGHF